MWRNRVKVLVTLAGITTLGIGLSLGYPGFGSASPSATGCPFLEAPEESKIDAPAGVCPYSGMKTKDGESTSPDRQSSGTAEKAKCPYAGSERDVEEAEVDRRPLEPREKRNLV